MSEASLGDGLQPNPNLIKKETGGSPPGISELDRNQFEVVPAEDVLKSAEKYRSFYKLPDQIFQRAAETQAFRLSREQLFQLCVQKNKDKLARIDKELSSPTLDFDKDDHPAIIELNREILTAQRKKLVEDMSNEQGLWEEVQETGGMFFISPEGNREIYINKDDGKDESSTLDHEVLHTLSTESSHCSGIESVSTKGDMEYIALNEAATEVLRILVANPELNAFDLYARQKDGIIETAYKDEVRTLLMLFSMSQMYSNVPITLSDLSSAYFGLEIYEGMSNRGFMIAGLIPEMMRKTGDTESVEAAQSAERFLETLK